MNTDPLLTRLTVSEMFGPTIQGEGPSQGRSVVFLRLGLCNLDCSWCDTPYTWDWTGKNGTVYDRDKELHTDSVASIAERLIRQASVDGEVVARRIVISGGEPMVQQRRLTVLIDELRGYGFTFEIETNGTIVPDADIPNNLVSAALDGVVAFNCSPKLSNSGIPFEKRINPEALFVISELPSILKFVVETPDDIEEIEALVYGGGYDVDPHRIFLMPQGIEAPSITDRLEWVMDEAARRGWSVSPRLHVLAYGNKRGV